VVGGNGVVPGVEVGVPGVGACVPDGVGAIVPDGVGAIVPVGVGAVVPEGVGACVPEVAELPVDDPPVDELCASPVNESAAAKAKAVDMVVM